jgi:hypothetical protein
MKRRRRKKQETLLGFVEKECRRMLNGRVKLTAGERIKVLDTLKAVALVRHRVSDKEDEHGSFFADK